MLTLEECSNPINKAASLGISRKSKINSFNEEPSLLTEKFKDIQLRLYGRVIAVDITGWKLNNLTVIGLYKFPNRQYANVKNETDKSLWAVKCSCGNFQLIRYSILKDISRGKYLGACNKCELLTTGKLHRVRLQQQ